MKKIFFVSFLAIILIILSFLGCSKSKSFTCALCYKTVNHGKAYSYTIEGDQYSICEDCYNELQELKQGW